MQINEAKYKANSRYNKKVYERIALLIRRDAEINGDYIRSHAEAMGESMNSFIKRAFVETIERDKLKQEVAVEATEVQTPSTASEKKPAFKQSRWVRVHEQGESGYEVKDNVMHITIGEGSYLAEITYKTPMVRTFNKAVYWFLRGLTNARADEIAKLATEPLTTQAAAASKETTEIAASGNCWNCKIVKAEDCTFKITMNWA